MICLVLGRLVVKVVLAYESGSSLVRLWVLKVDLVGVFIPEIGELWVEVGQVCENNLLMVVGCRFRPISGGSHVVSVVVVVVLLVKVEGVESEMFIKGPSELWLLIPTSCSRQHGRE